MQWISIRRRSITQKRLKSGKKGKRSSYPSQGWSVNRTIWMYWENPRGWVKPPYLDLCLETVRRHSPSYRVVVLDEKSLFDHLPDLRPDVFRIRRIAQRSDYIRASIVHTHGGIYLDSDVILLREIDVEALVEQYGLVACSAEYGKPSMGFFAASAGNLVLAEWITRMDAVLDAVRHRPLARLTGYRLSWTSLYHLVWEALRGREYHSIPFKRFVPLNWTDWEWFFRTDLQPEDVIDGDTIGVMLFNKFMQDRLATVSRDEILASPTLLGRLLRLSLYGERAGGCPKPRNHRE